MALAHIGGFAERLPRWLATSQQQYSVAMQVQQRVFDALQTGDAATVEAALRDPDRRKMTIWLGMGLGSRAPPTRFGWIAPCWASSIR